MFCACILFLVSLLLLRAREPDWHFQIWLLKIRWRRCPSPPPSSQDSRRRLLVSQRNRRFVVCSRGSCNRFFFIISYSYSIALFLLALVFLLSRSVRSSFVDEYNFEELAAVYQLRVNFSASKKVFLLFLF